jgi:hypothetical protein
MDCLLALLFQTVVRVPFSTLLQKKKKIDRYFLRKVNNFHYSPNILRVLKLRRMRWVEHVAQQQVEIHTEFLCKTQNERVYLVDLVVDKRRQDSLLSIVVIRLKIQTSGRLLWTIINIRFPQKPGYFLTNWGNAVVWRRNFRIEFVSLEYKTSLKSNMQWIKYFSIIALFLSHVHSASDTAKFNPLPTGECYFI